MLKVQGKLDIEAAGLAQDYDGSVILPASEARLHGDEIKYETGPQRGNIGFWLQPRRLGADWTFQATRPGKFDVTAEVAALDKASVEVAVGNSKTVGTPQPPATTVNSKW